MRKVAQNPRFRLASRPPPMPQGHKRGFDFYEHVESDVAFGDHALALPSRLSEGHVLLRAVHARGTAVLETNAIRYFDCRPLAKNVRPMVAAREWRFTNPPSARMLKWMLSV